MSEKYFLLLSEVSAHVFTTKHFPVSSVTVHLLLIQKMRKQIRNCIPFPRNNAVHFLIWFFRILHLGIILLGIHLDGADAWHTPGLSSGPADSWVCKGTSKAAFLFGNVTALTEALASRLLSRAYASAGFHVNSLVMHKLHAELCETHTVRGWISLWEAS